MNYQHNKEDKRFWFGIVLVLLGGVWLLRELDIIPYFISDYIFSLGTLFLLIGAFLTFIRKKIEVGIVFFALSAFFFMKEFYWFSWRDIYHVFWPIVVMVIGISLILRRNRLGSADEKKNDLDYVDDFAIFGGHDRTITSQNFKGGKVTAIFGGSDINLGDADLSPDQNVLDVFVLFGGTTIKVPMDWTVKVEVFSFLGGFGDSRAKSSVKVVPDPNKVLVVKGFAMFGGGDIKGV